MIQDSEKSAPAITIDQVADVDRLANEDYGIDLIQLMENAGRSLAYLAKVKFLKNELQNKKVYVVAGSGGNGAGALVAARRLAIWGADVKVVLAADPAKLKPITKYQYNIITKMKLPVVEKLGRKVDLVIDGIIGCRLKGEPKGPQKTWIDNLNEIKLPILSLDNPSGLDMTTGTPTKSIVKAGFTLTLGMPKVGLFKARAIKFVGKLYLADIGIPLDIFTKIGLKKEKISDIFTQSDIVKINKIVIFD